jgi:hypothetical protein
VPDKSTVGGTMRVSADQTEDVTSKAMKPAAGRIGIMALQTV